MSGGGQGNYTDTLEAIRTDLEALVAGGFTSKQESDLASLLDRVLSYIENANPNS